MTNSNHSPADLRGLALGTLFPGFAGVDAPPPRVADLIADGLGGVVLFGRNIDPHRGDAGITALTASLRVARPDLLVAVDEEGGDVTRLDVATGSSFPGSAALGAVDDPSLTSEVAGALGDRLAACGIDVNLAPVADIDADPMNPVIGVRAFGADHDLVARHVAAFVTGQQARGVAATVKHFPGHGGTAEDSHVALPVLPASRRVLDDRELVPFRAAIAAGTRLVMTAHIVVPSLDPDNPATMSRAVITGLLRGELGYDGVVMTDGLDMHAISRTVGHSEGAVRALLAGVDAVCVGGDSTDPELVERIVGAIVGAVRSGRLPVERLVEAAGRIRELASWTVARRPPAAANGVPVLGGFRGADPSPAVRAARRAVTSRGKVSVDAPPLVLELQDDPSLAAGRVPWGVGAPLAARLPGTVVVPITESGPGPASDLAAHPDRPVVVSVRGVRRRRWQLATIDDVRRLRPDAVVVDHDLSDPGAYRPPYVLAYGASRVAADVVADLLHRGGT